MGAPPLVRFLLLGALALANLHVVWSPDVVPNSLFAFSVIREGNVDYDEFTFIERDAYFFRACGESTATEPPRQDRICSIFPPGAAILALPLFAPAALAGADPEDLGLQLLLGKLAGALWSAGAAVLLIAAMGRLTTPRWALLLGLLFLLATSVRTVASQALWQHGAVLLLLCAALWVLVRLFTGERVSAAALFGAGLALGFAIAVRQTSVAFAAAAMLALALAGGPSRSVVRPWALLAVGVFIGALPLFAYNALAFGDPIEQGYGTTLFTTPIWEGLYGLLLSPSRGIFVYSPFLLFALSPLLFSWRAPGQGHVAPLLAMFALAALALILLYALYAEWWGGRVFGARFLSDALPVLFLALAWAGPPRGVAAWAFGIAAAWALLLHNAAAFAYDASWDTLPTSVNHDPSRLFVWGDPQWLSVLRDAAAPDPRAILALALSLLVLGALLSLERRALRGR